MVNKRLIIGSVLLLAGIGLFFLLDWPLAWGAIIMAVLGVIILAAPALKGRGQGRSIYGGRPAQPMRAGRIATQRTKYQGQSVPCIHLTNNAHSVDFLGFLPIDGNTIRDHWTGLGWEIQSDPTEIFLNGVSQGMGFICDEAGVTIGLKREIKFLPVNAMAGMTIPPNSYIEIPQKPNEAIRVKLPEGKEIGVEVGRVPTVNVFAKFEGMVGSLTSLDAVGKSINLEPSSRTIMINRIVFTIVGAFVLRPVLSAIFHI